MKIRYNHFIRFSIALSCASLAFTFPASATIVSWDGGAATTDWQTAINWSGDVANTDFDGTFANRLNVNSAQKLVYTSAEGTTNYTGDPTPTSGGNRGLVIGSGSSGTMEISGGTFSTLGAAGQDIIGNGNSSTGILTVNGGTFIGTNAGTNLGIGTGSGRVSTLNVSSGRATMATLNLNSSNATVNLSGTGILEVNNISMTASSTGRINFDGGTLLARASSGAFITGLTAATINGGGATIDSSANAITIGQALLAGTGSGGLTKLGSGTLTLSSSASTYTGETRISAGALSVGNVVVSGGSSALGNATSAVILGSADAQGTLSYTGNSVNYTRGFTVGGAGGGRLNVTTAAQTLTVETGGVTGSGLFTVGGAGNTTITSSLSHTGGLTKADAGTLLLSNSSSYTGATAVTGGILAIGHKDALSGTSSITVGTATNSTTSLRIDVADTTSILTGAGKSVTIRGLGSSNNGALLGADSTSVTWAGDVVLGDTTGARIGGGANGTLTVDGVISETTAGSSVLFSRAANSTTILNKANTYTGDTLLFMNGSTVTLKVGVANAISSSSRMMISSTTSGTGFFDLNGFNQNIRAISDNVGGDLVVTNSSATADAELMLSTTDAQTFGGWIQDGATRKTSLVMSGTGSQNFTNINTYTGGTRIDSGTLTLGHASNTLADTGAINVNGGTLALGANSDTVGAVRLTSGSITGSTGTLTGSSYDVRSGSISARLAGTGVTLTKSTSGTVTLTGTNTYTGATNVDAGKLVISSTGSTAAGSAVAVSNSGSELVVDGTLGGALTVYSGAILSGSGTISGSTTIAGIHNAGNSPGIQTFSSDLSYQAGSTVNWELGGNTTTQALPAIFDQIVVGGNLSFAATTTVNLLFNTAGSLVDWSNALWDSNQSWTLFDVAGTTTGLENVALTTSNWADSNGALFNTVRNGAFFTLSFSGQDVMLNYTAVPETSVSLLGGLSALLLLRRKRR